MVSEMASTTEPRNAGQAGATKLKRPQKFKQELQKLRCPNCPKTFTQTRPWQRFCTPACKAQFHRAGGAYYKLKQYCERLVKTATREAFEAQHKEIEQTRAELESVRLQTRGFLAKLIELTNAAKRQ